MWAIIYYAAYLLAAILMGDRIFSSRPMPIRIWLGGVIGIVANAWLPALWAFAFGYGITAHVLALVTFLVMIGMVLLLYHPDTYRHTASPEYDEWKAALPFLYFAVPAMILMAILFYNHIMVPGADGLYAGQCTYGDTAMHMGMITSIAEQKSWPPDYSILSGVRMSYPFLADSQSSSMVLMGLPLRWSIIIPSLVQCFFCFWGIYHFAYEFSKKQWTAIVSCLLFFLNGGLGFLVFLKNGGELYSQLLTGFYVTPTNYPDLDIRWVNVICDMMLPQRTTLMGWSILPASLYLAYYTVVEGSNKIELIAAAILAGSLVMIHTHTATAVTIICVVWLIVYLFRKTGSDRKEFIKRAALFAGIMVALALPQFLFWTISQATSEHFIRLSPGWVTPEDHILDFWVINIGIALPLLVIAFISKWRERWAWYSGALVLFIISNIWIFQPNPYDNNKLLYVWYLFSVVIIADWLVDLFRRIRFVWLKIAGACLVAVLLFTSAGCTIAREINSGGQYRTFSTDELALAEQIRENTDTKALFITGSEHINLVAVLTGRNIYVGSPTFLYFHGLSYQDRQDEVRRIYEDPRDNLDLLSSIGADYILITSHEREEFAIDTDGIEQCFTEVFRDGSAVVYKVQK